MADEVIEKYPDIKVYKIENGKDLELTKAELNKIFEI